jgi:uncharacterized repeat protein (TIGR03843 family)
MEYRSDFEEYARYYARSIERLLKDKPPAANWRPDAPAVLDYLAEADVVDCDLLPSGSNYAYLLTLQHKTGGTGLAVYKPREGEAPLWDFPTGSLYLRETAAFELSRAIGWDIVPPTVVRDGPMGVGSVQLFIDADLEQNYFTMRDRRRSDFEVVALFDCLANNADRKAGHCLLDREGRIWCIDHGLTFHEQWKLRTVIWDFYDSAVPERLVDDLKRLRMDLAERPEALEGFLRHLTTTERRAFERRLAGLLARPCYPPPGPHRSIPWPPV